MLRRIAEASAMPINETAAPAPASFINCLLLCRGVIISIFS
jgi:hypothetical protein